MVAYARTVKTASGATAEADRAVVALWISIDRHVGSARDEDELAARKTAATERLETNQAVLDLAVSHRRGPNRCRSQWAVVRAASLRFAESSGRSRPRRAVALNRACTDGAEARRADR